MKYWTFRTWILPFTHLWEIKWKQSFLAMFCVFSNIQQDVWKKKKVFPLLLFICLHIPWRRNYLICEVLFSFVRLLCLFYSIFVWSLSTFELSEVFYLNDLTSGNWTGSSRFIVLRERETFQKALALKSLFIFSVSKHLWFKKKKKSQFQFKRLTLNIL